MERVRFCILGAGPTGLSFARELKRNGVESFVVLESESEAGGLCRSQTVDGFSLDIGGGHFLDPRRKEVVQFLFELMPESEWNHYQRIARIRFRGKEVDHPLEANIWQLPVHEQVDLLESIAMAGSVRGSLEPERFDAWIRWKLGDRIAEDYMLPYNRKIWSLPVDQLGTYWLHKLPSVSFQDTLRSCLERRASGSLPAHGEFYYPKHHGYGEVWRRIGSDLGDRLLLSHPVTSVDPDGRVINGAFEADTIVNTIPWATWQGMGAIPRSLEPAVRALFWSSIDVDYHPLNVDSPAHWVYDPSEEVPHHRLLLRHNFVPGSRGHWTETNSERSTVSSGFRHRNEFAYPLNTVAKPSAMKEILEWAASKHILPLGRWGRWEHMNSDVAVELAIEAARRVARA